MAASAHHSLVGGGRVRGRSSFVRGGCRRPWAVWWLLSLGAVCCGRWVIVGGHRVTWLWVGGLLFVGGGCHCGCWVFVGGSCRCGCWVFVGGWLFVDGLFVGGLFVDWVVVCGRGGAVSCVVCHG